jgi:hypothetical protein
MTAPGRGMDVAVPVAAGLVWAAGGTVWAGGTLASAVTGNGLHAPSLTVDNAAALVRQGPAALWPRVPSWAVLACTLLVAALVAAIVVQVVRRVRPWLRDQGSRASVAGVRAEHGTVWTFDPQRIAYTPQRFVWNPLAGVTTVEEAHRLAGHFVVGVESTGDKFWSAAATDLLTSLLLAAGVTGGTLREVYTWLSDPTGREPIDRLEAAGHLDAARGLAARANGADKTRDGIYETARTAAQCLRDPGIMAWVTPREDLPTFDPSAFALTRDTVCLLSKDGAGSAAPLVAALTDRVMREATRTAERTPTGRLDPPLVMVLDEAANGPRRRPRRPAARRGRVPARRRPRRARPLHLPRRRTPIRIAVPAPSADPRRRTGPGAAQGHRAAAVHRPSDRPYPALALVSGPAGRPGHRRRAGSRRPPRGTGVLVKLKALAVPLLATPTLVLALIIGLGGAGQTAAALAGCGTATGTGATLAKSAARAAGFPEAQLDTAAAVAGAESGWNPTATNLNGRGHRRGRPTPADRRRPPRRPRRLRPDDHLRARGPGPRVGPPPRPGPRLYDRRRPGQGLPDRGLGRGTRHPAAREVRHLFAAHLVRRACRRGVPGRVERSSCLSPLRAKPRPHGGTVKGASRRCAMGSAHP